MRSGRGRGLYRRFCRPSNFEWADYLGCWGGLHMVGRDVSINLGCNITDPHLVRIGNNVMLSDCTLQGDGRLIRILNTRYGKKLDSVGPVDIRDNCFIGYGSIVMPNVTIGPDAIVAAGAVVTGGVPPGMVVGGNPARPICSTEGLVDWLEKRAYDARLEPRLKSMRVEHFFGDGERS